MALERLSKEKVIEMFNFYNLTPIIKEYRNAQQKITAFNKDGYKVFTNANALQQRISKNLDYNPLPFSPNNPHTLENIERWLINNNRIIILSKKNIHYIKNNSKLIWECPKHGEFKNTWQCVQNSTNKNKFGGCQKCGNISAGVKNSRNHSEFIILLKESQPKVFNALYGFESEYIAAQKPIYVNMKYGVCKTTPHRLLNNKIPTI